MQAKRINGFHQLDREMICYWKTDYGWQIYFPKYGIGGLGKHKIDEHEDGTITVSPSILITFWVTDDGVELEGPMTIHGFLEKGVWRDV